MALAGWLCIALGWSYLFGFGLHCLLSARATRRRRFDRRVIQTRPSFVGGPNRDGW